MVTRDGESESDRIAASKALMLIILCVTVKVFAQMTACQNL
jgi:hypothetical protein